jgi:hypothetical protein
MARVMVFAGSFVIFMGLSFLIARSISTGKLYDARELDWRFLGSLDFITGNISDSIREVNGEFVKVPGFMVPLEDNVRETHEFLLVPTPQACIHVPPPPPNQMVHVKMERGRSTQVSFGPIWVYGTLKISNVRHLYGESSYQLEAIAIEPYR